MTHATSSRRRSRSTARKLHELEDDVLLLPAEAAALVPGGTSPQSIVRWCRDGIRHATEDRVVRLESQRAGRRVVVTVGALRRFFREAGGAA